MAINERLVHTASASAAAGTGNQEEGLMLHLDANDVDSYDGDGDVWYDIHDHEYTPATNVSEHFNTVLYTGDGNADRDITGVGFTPDLVWTKNRSTNDSHQLYDSLRGNYGLYSNGTDAQFLITDWEIIDDGFDLGAANNGRNGNGNDIVAWCFKAGGLINKAAYFNGSSSYVNLPSNPISGTGDYSVSVWAKCDNLSAGNSGQQYITQFGSIASSGGGTVIAKWATSTGSANKIYIHVGGGYVLTSHVVVLGAWTHYAITQTGTSILFYVNGNLHDTLTAPSSPNRTSGNSSIGYYNEGSHSYFGGNIQQVRIFNSVLTSSQITQLYNETPEENNGHLLGCVAAYPLGENANDVGGLYNGTASNVNFGLPGYANRNNEGTIESTVSVNNDLGFSVATYTGVGYPASSTAEIGHGLDTPPELVMIKGVGGTGQSGGAGSWVVGSSLLGSGWDGSMYLNSDAAAYTANNYFWNGAATSSVIKLKNDWFVNGVNNNYVAYSFASKRGVSKVGSYTGTGATGNKVYTGFEPAFVIVKRTNGTGNWMMHDNKRSANNGDGQDLVLYSDLNNSEDQYSSGGLTFDNDGFTINVTSTSANLNNSNYIYYAVAKDTNETELADTVGFKPSIDPEDHFNTVTYTGDASTRSITGVGFQPDLLWIKKRSSSTNASNMIFDSVRGADKVIISDSTQAQYDGGGTGGGYQNSFNADGFTVTGNVFVNQSSEDYVAWCFNAGGNEVTNTDGTVNSTVRANNDLGFSIVKYNGLNTAVTAGHGLESPPEMVICKPLVAGAWAVWHKDMASDLDKNYIPLTTGATSPNASSLWNYSNWGATKIGSSNPLMFGTNNDIIAYCFASKRGVSKVGSFEGTGASGNKIYTEFEPAFVMWKNADNSASNSMWFMFDNQRGESAYLMANSNSIEGTDASVQFHRDGFTVPNAGAINNSGQTHIYYAVAKNTNNEQPHLELNLEADSYSGSGDWLDSSGNGNNGTITGATHNDELGDFFDLDGSGDYIDIPTSGVFTGDFTVEMWWNFNTLSPPSGSAYRMLLGASGYSGGSGLGHYIENNRLRTWVSVNGSTSNVLNGSGTDLTTNKWQHVVLTRSGGTYTQYIDTNQVGQASGTTASLDGANSRIGGHYNVASSHDINAKVGQVRLYDTALSQAQIRQNYNFTKPSYPNGFDAALTNMSSSDFDPSDGHFTFSADNDRMQTSFQPNVTVPFTASVWVKRNSGNSGYKIVIDYTQNASPYNGFGIFHDGTGDYGMAINGGTDVTIGSETSGFDHLVFVYNGGTSCKTYINGVGTTRTLNNAIAQPNTSTNFVVGNSYVSTWSSSRMDVSDVKFYDRALTDYEVTAQHGIGYNGIG